MQTNQGDRLLSIKITSLVIVVIGLSIYIEPLAKFLGVVIILLATLTLMSTLFLIIYVIVYSLVTFKLNRME